MFTEEQQTCCKLLLQTNIFILRFTKCLSNGCHVSKRKYNSDKPWRDIMFFSSSHVCDVHYACVTRCHSCYARLYFWRLVRLALARALKNLRKCWHAVSVYKSNLMEQSKLLNFQQLLLFPAHCGKVIFRSGLTVSRLAGGQGGCCIISHL